jgi:hypothetical protein
MLTLQQKLLNNLILFVTFTATLFALPGTLFFHSVPLIAFFQFRVNHLDVIDNQDGLLIGVAFEEIIEFLFNCIIYLQEKGTADHRPDYNYGQRHTTSNDNSVFSKKA